MMRSKLASLCLLVGFGVSGAVLLAQRAAEGPKPAQGVEAKLYIVTPSQIKWTDPPVGVARGTPSVAPGSPLRYAPIQGDPLKPGVPFAIRLRCSDGYKAAPHWHPADENIVVLEEPLVLAQERDSILDECRTFPQVVMDSYRAG
jgi:hypothetical protein